jgi:hypothetical protein
MRLMKLLLAAGIGILFIWVTACLVNVLRFHRFEWFYAYSHDFLYSGVALVLIGGTCRLLDRGPKPSGTLPAR